MNNCYTRTGFNTITPYIMVRDAKALISFLEAIFGATIIDYQQQDNIVSNAEIKIGNSMIMIADTPKDYQPQTAMLYIYVEDVDATYKKAIEAGANSLRKPTDQHFGDRQAGVEDSFGNQWWIATCLNKTSEQIC